MELPGSFTYLHFYGRRRSWWQHCEHLRRVSRRRIGDFHRPLLRIQKQQIVHHQELILIKLVLHVFMDSCKPEAVMEMDKFYTGYGGAAVLWISITTLKKRFKNPDY